jgi:hypothetical protein
MNRTYIKDLKDHVGKEITISGWVDIRRDHGKLIFIDIRDMSGKIQTVALPNNKEAHEVANKVRSEWVISATGIINKRPEKMIAKDKVTGEIESNGDIELELKKIEVLNEAQTPPIDVRSEGTEIGEEARLKYRYVDLRRPRLQKNIRNRGAVMLSVRNSLTNQGFTEIETPYMSATTPEGSRDYVVPSRLEKGKPGRVEKTNFAAVLPSLNFHREFACGQEEVQEQPLAWDLHLLGPHVHGKKLSQEGAGPQVQGGTRPVVVIQGHLPAQVQTVLASVEATDFHWVPSATISPVKRWTTCHHSPFWHSAAFVRASSRVGNSPTKACQPQTFSPTQPASNAYAFGTSPLLRTGCGQDQPGGQVISQTLGSNAMPQLDTILCG